VTPPRGDGPDVSGSAPPAPPRPLSITPAGIVGTLLLAVVMALCVRLGFWQLDRRHERLQLNEHIAARLHAAPLAGAAALTDTAGIFYRTATIHGEFDHDRSVVLPGRSHRGVPGVHLITPLRVTGRADALLVNRGWVPSPDAATIDVRDFAATDTASVRGLVLPFPGAAQSLAQREQPIAAEDAGFRRVWYTLNDGALRAQYPYELLPALLQALPGDGPAAAGRTGHPTRLEPPPLDEGPHLGYALQWFSFALIGLIGWIAILLRSRTAPRSTAPPMITAVVALLCAATPASGQLRPIDGMDWRIFDRDHNTIASIGSAVLWDQAATLAGTRGRLLELVNYSVSYRSGRFAIALGGTGWLQFRDDLVYDEPIGGARPPDGSVRKEAGRATAETMLVMTEPHWPVDFVVRFGAVLPTTSYRTGLDRDRTDFFALAGLRYTTGGLSLMTEHGVGIFGTIYSHYPQADVWAHVVAASYEHRVRRGPTVRGVVSLVGHQDGHPGTVRGNEVLREIRTGVDIGKARALRIRYVRGLTDASPAHGLQVGASALIRLPF
jgi:surfeit locus 1 family protein